MGNNYNFIQNVSRMHTHLQFPCLLQKKSIRIKLLMAPFARMMTLANFIKVEVENMESTATVSN